MVAAARALDALGDPTRRVLLERLREQPLAVGQLAAGLPVSRPAVSRHLRVLGEAGLVRATAVGRTRLYSVAPAGLREVQLWLNTFWDDVLGALATDIETTTGPGTDQEPS
jgi:DNA-binding transcriptional ArsR family regulator